MTIACVGWGSLVWNPKSLPAQLPWQVDGPTLPVEYARQSKGGRLTLVLVETAALVTTLWAPLRVHSLSDAVEALRMREKTKSGWIGRWPSADPLPFVEEMGVWAEKKALSGVVWTALPPKFNGIDGRVPTAEEAVYYLAGLEGRASTDAEEYVRNTPRQIRTTYREYLEANLGWRED